MSEPVKPTVAQLKRLREIAGGQQLRTRQPRFGPYRGLLGVTSTMARNLEDAGWIEWRDEVGRVDVLAQHALRPATQVAAGRLG